MPFMRGKLLRWNCKEVKDNAEDFKGVNTR